MNLVLLSDTHLRHGRVIVPDGDAVLFAGDMCLGGRRIEEVGQFAEWFAALPHRIKIAIAGNHDFPFQKNEIARQIMLEAGITYLQDSGVEIESLKFWGSPWQPWFGDWAFNLPRGQALAEKWDLIPADTDVLITHGPPRGILDPGRGEPHVGCDALLSQVTYRIKPRLHVFGHLHSGYGREDHGETIFINASVVDELYEPVNPPIVVEIP